MNMKIVEPSLSFVLGKDAWMWYLHMKRCGNIVHYETYEETKIKLVWSSCQDGLKHCQLPELTTWKWKLVELGKDEGKDGLKM